MDKMFRIFISLMVGLFLVGVTMSSHAGITSKVKKTAKKTASKANDTVHKGANKVRDNEKVKRADKQAKSMADQIGDTYDGIF